MLTKWFIGVKAVSKGYFTGFNWCNPYEKNVKLGVKPSFTQQTALALGYKTESEAIEAIDTLHRKPTQKDLDNTVLAKNSIIELSKIYSGLSLEDKVNHLEKFNIRPEYTDSMGRERTLNIYRYNNEFNEAETTIIEKIDFNKHIDRKDQEIENFKRKLEFINNKLLVREVPIEFKFMDRERKSIKWVERGEHDTARDYCMCCGGAIPSVPQLRISCVGSICAICMKKLGDESQLYFDRVDPDILEHYTTDRFLRSM